RERHRDVLYVVLVRMRRVQSIGETNSLGLKCPAVSCEDRGAKNETPFTRPETRMLDREVGEIVYSLMVDGVTQGSGCSTVVVAQNTPCRKYQYKSNHLRESLYPRNQDIPVNLEAITQAAPYGI